MERSAKTQGLAQLLTEFGCRSLPSLVNVFLSSLLKSANVVGETKFGANAGCLQIPRLNLRAVDTVGLRCVISRMRLHIATSGEFGATAPFSGHSFIVSSI